MPGKLIVFEGTDGSGKSTQFHLACEALKQKGMEFRTCRYPQYQEESSAPVRMYLRGEFGRKPSDVNAYAASSFYAVDRYAGYKKYWGEFYHNGGTMVLDRYTTSNAVHQSSKMNPADREDFFQWLADFEYVQIGLPTPDLVIWLDTPVALTVENMRRREQDTSTTADIHEVDVDYLTACHDAAAQAAAFYGWHRIACADEAGSLRTIEDIHQEIMALINS